MASEPLDGRARARTRWRIAKCMITVPLVVRRLQRSATLALAREAPLQLKEAGQLGHANYLRKLSVGCRLGGLVEDSLVDVRVDRAADSASQLVRRGSVVTMVESAEDVEKNQWWDQGDVALSTRAKFQQRFKLRHAPMVNEVLHAFWSTAVQARNIARATGGGASEESASEELLDAMLDFASYYELYKRAYRVLLHEYDEADARRIIQEDFNNDAKGDGQLTNSEFGDALYCRPFATLLPSSKRVCRPLLSFLWLIGCAV